jgi:hypothetical protein
VLPQFVWAVVGQPERPKQMGRNKRLRGPHSRKQRKTVAQHERFIPAQTVEKKSFEMVPRSHTIQLAPNGIEHRDHVTAIFFKILDN